MSFFASSSITKGSRLLSLFIIVVSLSLFCFGQYVGGLCLLPALFGDILCSAVLPRKDKYMTSTLLKAMLLAQGLGVWWLWSSYNSFSVMQIYEESSLDPRAARLTHTNRMHDTITTTRRLRKSPHNDIQPTTTSSRYFSQAIATSTPSYLSNTLISQVIGALPPVSFPDLRYRSSHEIRDKMQTVFKELPSDGFLPDYKNPCWIRSGQPMSEISAGRLPTQFACLPYAYILGMPKCGTSDLYERLSKHPLIETPHRKEVRWFTRGEFTTKAMVREGDFPAIYKDPLPSLLVNSEIPVHSEKLLGSESSIYTFTASFNEATRTIAMKPSSDGIIAIDGGPHTLWWPTQSPDGELLPEDIPPPQLIREIQPHAKFIITLTDPVKRMYSDYYFLNDDLKPVNPRNPALSTKSAAEFHERSVQQVAKFRTCVKQVKEEVIRDLTAAGSIGEAYLHDTRDQHDDEYDALWFRASQICAHDRHRFAIAGYGRLAIGLYSLFIEKWLEHFPMEQFLIIRLEDYKSDAKAYMQQIFHFLGLDAQEYEDAPVNWDAILTDRHFNENRNTHKEALLEDTEHLLRDFYQPYNHYLSIMLNNSNYDWISPVSLRSKQLVEAEQARLHPVAEEKHDKANGGRRDPRKPRHARDVDHNIIDEDKQPDHNHDPYDRKRAAMEERRHDSNPHEIPPHIQHQHSASHPLLMQLHLQPHNFSLEGLIAESVFGSLVQDLDLIERVDPSDEKPTFNHLTLDLAAKQLCYSAFALDTAAMKYLLYDVGLSPDLHSREDFNRSPLQCLAMIGAMVEANPRSQLFAMLKGVDTFLTSLFQPPLPLQLHSVHTRTILNNLGERINQVGRWLVRAGANLRLTDSGGNTFLHHAAQSGLLSLVQVTLSESSLSADDEWELVNLANKEGRTALHYAAAYGHAELLQYLIEHQGNMEKQDDHQVSPMDIITSNGPISAADAMQHLHIQQHEVKHIPERASTHMKRDKGGWRSTRLSGYEDDYRCDMDQYYAHEITGEEIFYKYIARNTPVLIHGLLEDWPANQLYSKDNFTAAYGNLSVEVSDIPYTNKFGGAGKVTMTLGEYIIDTTEHHVVGGDHPWYVFKGHPVPSISESDTSTVPYAICPTPQIIYDAVKKFYPKDVADIHDVHSRDMFVNAQFALGGEGTGAPVHFHNSAWSALVYGAKKWVVYPPRDSVMSNMQIKQYFEEDMVTISQKGAHTKTCVQLAGDVMIIPENYGHGVLNLEESIAVASEIKQSVWRMKPGTNIIGALPFDNTVQSGQLGKKHPRGVRPPH